MFLRKISPASLSIMPGREHNFDHDAKILGVMLKSITLKFSSILYLTLSSKLSVNSWFTIPYVEVCAYFISDSVDIPILFFLWQNLFYHFLVCSLYQKPNIDVTGDFIFDAQFGTLNIHCDVRKVEIKCDHDVLEIMYQFFNLLQSTK